MLLKKLSISLTKTVLGQPEKASKITEYVIKFKSYFVILKPLQINKRGRKYPQSFSLIFFSF